MTLRIHSPLWLTLFGIIIDISFLLFPYLHLICWSPWHSKDFLLRHTHTRRLYFYPILYICFTFALTEVCPLVSFNLSLVPHLSCSNYHSIPKPRCTFGCRNFPKLLLHRWRTNFFQFSKILDLFLVFYLSNQILIGHCLQCMKCHPFYSHASNANIVLLRPRK